MSVSGGLAGLFAEVAFLAWPGVGPPGAAWALAAIACATGFGAAAPTGRMKLRSLAILVGLALCAGVGARLGGGRGQSLASGLFFALPVAVIFARGLTGRRFLVGLGLGSVGALVARFVATRFAEAPELAGLPGWLVALAAGVGFAFPMVVALLARHVDVVVDRVAEARARHRARLSGEVAELADRAHALWQLIEAQTADRQDPVRRAIEDSVVRLFEVAGRWQEVESDGARTSAAALAERMQQVDAKLEATTDPVAKDQYGQARAALAEQLRYLKEIGTSRERVVARMHHYLAAMERLRFAGLNHRSHDASRLSTEVQPILADLHDLGRDIDLTSDALGEVEREAVVAQA